MDICVIIIHGFSMNLRIFITVQVLFTKHLNKLDQIHEMILTYKALVMALCLVLPALVASAPTNNSTSTTSSSVVSTSTKYTRKPFASSTTTTAAPTSRVPSAILSASTSAPVIAERSDPAASHAEVLPLVAETEKPVSSNELVTSTENNLQESSTTQEEVSNSDSPCKTCKGVTDVYDLSQEGRDNIRVKVKGFTFIVAPADALLASFMMLNEMNSIQDLKPPPPAETPSQSTSQSEVPMKKIQKFFRFFSESKRRHDQNGLM